MKQDNVYLSHILEFIENVLEDTSNFTEERFFAERVIKQATTRNIEMMGEAVKHLSQELTDNYPNIPWQKIARTRDMLIHHYFDVDDQQLWKIVTDDLPTLKDSIKNILQKIK